LTLKQGLFALGECPVVNGRIFKGLKDTLSVLQEKTEDDAVLQTFSAELASATSREWPDILGIRDQLQKLLISAEGLVPSLHAAPEAAWWGEALLKQIR